MGIGVIESIASVDEIKKTTTNLYKKTKQKMTKEIFEKAIEHMKTLDRVQRIDTMSQTSLKYDMTEKQYAELKELSESIPFNL